MRFQYNTFVSISLGYVRRIHIYKVWMETVRSYVCVCVFERERARAYICVCSCVRVCLYTSARVCSVRVCLFSVWLGTSRKGRFEPDLGFKGINNSLLVRWPGIYKGPRNQELQIGLMKIESDLVSSRNFRCEWDWHLYFGLARGNSDLPAPRRKGQCRTDGAGDNNYNWQVIFLRRNVKSRVRIAGRSNMFKQDGDD